MFLFVFTFIGSFLLISVASTYLFNKRELLCTNKLDENNEEGCLNYVKKDKYEGSRIQEEITSLEAAGDHNHNQIKNKNYDNSKVILEQMKTDMNRSDDDVSINEIPYDQMIDQSQTEQYPIEEWFNQHNSCVLQKDEANISMSVVAVSKEVIKRKENAHEKEQNDFCTELFEHRTEIGAKYNASTTLIDVQHNGSKRRLYTQFNGNEKCQGVQTAISNYEPEVNSNDGNFYERMRYIPVHDQLRT